MLADKDASKITRCRCSSDLARQRYPACCDTKVLTGYHDDASSRGCAMTVMATAFHAPATLAEHPLASGSQDHLPVGVWVSILPCAGPGNMGPGMLPVVEDRGPGLYRPSSSTRATNSSHRCRLPYCHQVLHLSVTEMHLEMHSLPLEHTGLPAAPFAAIQELAGACTGC